MLERPGEHEDRAGQMDPCTGKELKGLGAQTLEWEDSKHRGPGGLARHTHSALTGETGGGVRFIKQLLQARQHGCGAVWSPLHRWGMEVMIGGMTCSMYPAGYGETGSPSRIRVVRCSILPPWELPAVEKPGA